MSDGITKPGVYRMSAERYHADAVAEPSLSSGILRTLLAKTPRHAKEKHPRLAAAFEAEHKEQFDLGSAAHAMLLKDPSEFRIVDAPDWRSKDAKTERQTAYDAGQIPLLQRQYDETAAMVEAARAQLAEHDASDAFDLSIGDAELTLIWQEDNGVWCRCRPDWLPRARREGLIVYDYKWTATSVAPGSYDGRTMWQLGLHLQDAFYSRGVRRVFGLEDVRFRFAVQEAQPPHLLSVLQISEESRRWADMAIELGIDIWGRCLTSGVWPGYEQQIRTVDMPDWAERFHPGRMMPAELRDMEDAA